MEEPEQVALVALTPAQERDSRLTVLAMNLLSAKAAEERTKKNRIEIEELLAEEIPGEETGQMTITLANGTKITVKRGLSYKADTNGLSEAMEGEAKGISVPIKAKTTYELDVKGYEWYRKEKPEIFNLIAEYVTVTPRKVSVAVKKAGK